MAFTYYDAATLLFGSREFTTREFAARTGNFSAAKVLSRLKSRGLVERVSRGRYRCLAPEERPDLRAAGHLRVRRLLLEAPLRMAWTGASAVEVWTDGRYKVSSSVVRRVSSIMVPESEYHAWLDYLSTRNISTSKGKKLGPYVRVIPTVVWDGIEEVEGEPVISREATIALIREHPASYEGAEDWLIERPRKT